MQAGFGHNTWPVSSMADGFRFLVGEAAAPGRGACAADATAPLPQKGRFRVEAAWDANGSSGAGQAVPGASADSGLLWFFAPDNWELMVKVLDGCALNGHYWVLRRRHDRRPLRADGDRHPDRERRALRESGGEGGRRGHRQQRFPDLPLTPRSRLYFTEPMETGRQSGPQLGRVCRDPRAAPRDAARHPLSRLSSAWCATPAPASASRRCASAPPSSPTPG